MYDSKYPFSILKQHTDNFDNWLGKNDINVDYTFQDAINLANDYLWFLANTDTNNEYPIIFSANEDRTNARLIGLLFEKIVFETLNLDSDFKFNRTNENYYQRSQFDWKGWDLVDFDRKIKVQLKFKKVDYQYPTEYNLAFDKDNMKKVNITVFKDSLPDNTHSLVCSLLYITIISTTSTKIIDFFKKYVI